MFRNYFKSTIRNLVRHKTYSLINLAGLTIGLTCCLFISLYILNELQFDRHHANADRTYRVLNERFGQSGSSKMAFTPAAMGPAMKREFPEVLESVRLFAIGKILIEVQDTRNFEENAFITEPSIFKIFTIPLIAGDPETALSEPYSLVISETIAGKYFGQANPVGQEILIDSKDRFIVTGVFEDLPAASHLKVDFLGSFATMKDMVSDPARLESWVWQQFFTYILMPENHHLAELEAKFPDFVQKHAYEQISARGFTYLPFLQPLKDVYLKSAGLGWDFGGPRGNIVHVYSFFIVAVFILLIACFNFMNLSTARSLTRSREVGVRKVAGAKRSQLVVQFLSESIILSLVALILSIMLVEFLMPAFNNLTGRALTLTPYSNVGFIPLLLLMACFVGLIAGSYPAAFLSGFLPIKVLKMQLSDERTGHGRIRKWLVTSQFAISVFLIIATLVVSNQIQFIKSRDLGFNKEEIITLSLRADMKKNYENLKHTLTQNPTIVSASVSYGGMSNFVAGDDIRLPGHEETWPTSILIVDHDFVQTYEMTLVAGRDFSRDLSTDKEEAFLLNEAAAHGLGWQSDEAIGKEIWWDEWSGDGIKKGRVIGVVRDFNFTSLHNKILPIVMHIYPDVFASMSVRIKSDNIPETIAFLEKTWAKFAPGWPFEYKFLDQSLDAKYRSEMQFSKVLSGFSLLAIAIACLGLLGLSSFTVEQKTREVGIRKVLGASVASIVSLFSKDFVKLILFACVISCPVAYYLMSLWLQAFAYRITLGPALFLASGAVTLFIALLTIAFQAIRAAVANPVDSLRCE